MESCKYHGRKPDKQYFTRHSASLVDHLQHYTLQSLLVSILAGSGLLASSQDQKNLSNFLICMEMLPAAVGMLFAFPYLEYKGRTVKYCLLLKSGFAQTHPTQ